MSTYYLVTYFRYSQKLYYSGIFFSIKNPFATAWFVTSPTRPTAVVRCIIIVTAIITITIIILIHCVYSNQCEENQKRTASMANTIYVLKGN